MLAVVVTFQIKPGCMDEFLPDMIGNASRSLKDEPGCHRFDVCTDQARANEVFLYELYTDRAAFEAHLASAHYRSFDAVVAPLIAAKSVQIYDQVTS